MTDISVHCHLFKKEPQGVYFSTGLFQLALSAHIFHFTERNKEMQTECKSQTSAYIYAAIHKA